MCDEKYEIIEHDFWGEIDESYFGVSASLKKNIPIFEQEVTVHLGYEFDEDGEEIEEFPSMEELSEYEETYKSLCENMDAILIDIQQATFNCFKVHLADYYKKPDEVIRRIANKNIHLPLSICTKEEHFEYHKELLGWIRIAGDGVVIIPFVYHLDEEHGLEVKLVKNKVDEVGGISETLEY